MSLPAENVHPIEIAQPSNALTPMDMLSRALQSGATPELLEKLMALNDRWEANNARRDFEKALAAAKGEIPVITRNRSSHNSKYADFAAIAKVVDPILGKHGLSYRFRTIQTEKISVTCVLFGHGYSEENTLTAPVDSSVGKNPIQAIGSTLTYLQRYSLIQALGLAAADDDDGKSAGAEAYEPPPGSISPEQVSEIRKALSDKGASEKAFLQWAKVKRIEDIHADLFDPCLDGIATFRKK